MRALGPNWVLNRKMMETSLPHERADRNQKPGRNHYNQRFMYVYVKDVKKLEVDLNINDFEIRNSTKSRVEFKAGEGWGGGVEKR